MGGGGGGGIWEPRLIRARFPPTLWSLEGRYSSHLPTTTNALARAHRSHSSALVHVKPGKREWLQMFICARGLTDLLIAAARRSDVREPGRAMLIKMRQMQAIVDQRTTARDSTSSFLLHKAQFRMGWSMEFIRFRDTGAPSVESFALPQGEPSPQCCRSTLRLLLLLKMCGRGTWTISSLITCRCLPLKSPQTPTARWSRTSRTRATAAQATTLCGGSLWSLPCVRGSRCTVMCAMSSLAVGSSSAVRRATMMSAASVLVSKAMTGGMVSFTC